MTAIESNLAPSIEHRYGEWQEREKIFEAKRALHLHPTITISRLYGCEAFPLAVKLKSVLEEKTGELWSIFDKTLIDKALMEKEGLSRDLLQSLDEPSTYDDMIISSFMHHWTTKRDAHKLLCRLLLKIASQGNAIIVGRGAGILTNELKNCHQFRLEATEEYRVDTIAKRSSVSREEAVKIVKENQKNREKFMKSFLNMKKGDSHFYKASFNNERNSVDKIAKSLLELVFD